MQAFVLHKDASRERVLGNLIAFLKRLPDTRAWRVEIKQNRRKRSNAQNAALWGVAYKALSEATGHTPEELHEYMLGECFGWIDTEILGHKQSKPARTTTTGFDGRPATMSTVEFMDYYSFIQQRAAQHGIYVPDPGEDVE